MLINLESIVLRPLILAVALGWLTPAVAADPDLGRVSLGLEHYYDREYEKALAIWLPLARDGEMNSQVLVARLYEFGHGVAKDAKKAAFWYRKGLPLVRAQAEVDDRDFQFILARILLRGMGTARNDAEGLRWLERSVALEDTRAMAFLASLYATGEIVARDEPKARELYRQAGEWGYPEAHYQYALMLQAGRGGDANSAKAIEHMEKLAEGGHARAAVDAATAYEQGNGVRQDTLKAIRLYVKAAENGDKSAIKRATAQSVWLEQQAKSGDSTAQYQLGVVAGEGLLGTPEVKKAEYWLRKAIAQWQPNAMAFLGYLYTRHPEVLDVNLNVVYALYSQAALLDPTIEEGYWNVVDWVRENRADGVPWVVLQLRAAETPSTFIDIFRPGDEDLPATKVEIEPQSGQALTMALADLYRRCPDQPPSEEPGESSARALPEECRLALARMTLTIGTSRQSSPYPSWFLYRERLEEIRDLSVRYAEGNGVPRHDLAAAGLLVFASQSNRFMNEEALDAIKHVDRDSARQLIDLIKRLAVASNREAVVAEWVTRHPPGAAHD